MLRLCEPVLLPYQVLRAQLPIPQPQRIKVVSFHALVTFHATTFEDRHRQPWIPPDVYFIGRQACTPAHVVVVGCYGVQ